MRRFTLTLLLAAAPAAHADALLDALEAANRDTRAAIAQAKPNQQAALRYLAYAALAQHHALATARPGKEAQALRAATDAVTATLLPAAGRAAPAPSDAVARILARAAADRFDAPWSGSVPAAAGAWASLAQPARPPLLPQLGAMRTFYMQRGDEFRPPAPPAPGTAELAAGLDEVRRMSAAPDAARLASIKQWEMTSGALVAGYWNQHALELARRHGSSGKQAAAMLAAVMLATLDANIACHDAKYAYWTARPSQTDPTIRTHLGVPNHPSYPSNHACDSGAAAFLLAHFYPREEAQLSAQARAAADSRLYAGIHYRFDAEAGLEIARKVAARAIAEGPAALARLD
jgi:membrane-associated phospholipid phosphatase